MSGLSLLDVFLQQPQTITNYPSVTVSSPSSSCPLAKPVSSPSIGFFSPIPSTSSSSSSVSTSSSEDEKKQTIPTTITTTQKRALPSFLLKRRPHASSSSSISKQLNKNVKPLFAHEMTLTGLSSSSSSSSSSVSSSFLSTSSFSNSPLSFVTSSVSSTSLSTSLFPLPQLQFNDSFSSSSSSSSFSSSSSSLSLTSSSFSTRASFVVDNESKSSNTSETQSLNDRVKRYFQQLHSNELNRKKLQTKFSTYVRGMRILTKTNRDLRRKVRGHIHRIRAISPDFNLDQLSHSGFHVHEKSFVISKRITLSQVKTLIVRLANELHLEMENPNGFVQRLLRGIDEKNTLQGSNIVIRRSKSSEKTRSRQIKQTTQTNHLSHSTNNNNHINCDIDHKNEDEEENKTIEYSSSKSRGNHNSASKWRWREEEDENDDDDDDDDDDDNNNDITVSEDVSSDTDSIIVEAD